MLFYIIFVEIFQLPISLKEVKLKIARDSRLGKILFCVRKGWRVKAPSPAYQPYFTTKNKKFHRTPNVHRNLLLKERENHMGVVKI